MSEEEIEVKRKSAEVEALLERKDKINALIVSLQNPPVNSKSDDLKVRNKFTEILQLTNVSLGILRCNCREGFIGIF